MKNMVTGVKGDVRCTFGDEFDEEQFWNNDIPVLSQFLVWAEYFGIETHLPELIYQLSTMVNTREIFDLELFTEGVLHD
jgi:hypothetical protein